MTTISKQQPKVVRKISSDIQIPPDVLKVLLESSSQPLVISGQLGPWFESRSWKASDICQTLCSAPPTTFKVFPKRGTPEYEAFTGGEKRVLFETDCLYVEASFRDFKEWLMQSPDAIDHSQSDQNIDFTSPKKKTKFDDTVSKNAEKTENPSTDTSAVNPLLTYPGSHYWVYADYKYMCNICKDIPDLLASVDWDVCGFKGRSGKDSVLWIGSEGACTPCHYDTYGFNVVAQLSGEKKWTLFSPEDTISMYPTRVPFEELSVFSDVNVVDPDFEKYPLHKDATPYQVVLHEGDILVVPRHWWHYVESVGPHPSVSINTWIELPSDSFEKIKEALVRTLVSAFITDTSESNTDLLNPNEELFSNEDNIDFLSLALNQYKTSLRSNSTELEGSNPEEQNQTSKLDIGRFLKVLTSKNVIETMTNELCKSLDSPPNP